jgi:hypothetical protein
LGVVGCGILAATLGIRRPYSEGAQEDPAQFNARMAEAQAQQRQLLSDLHAAQPALSDARSRLEAQEALLSHKHMELLARQGARGPQPRAWIGPR